MVRTIALIAGLALALFPDIAHAQAATADHRLVAFSEVGVARTIAAESLLGDGISVSGGMGFKLTPGRTIQGLVNYVSYNRDDESVTFDGRVAFVGAEIVFGSTRPRVRPFISVGGGVFHVHDTMIRRRLISPGRIMSDPPITRDRTLKAMTGSGGIDIRVTDHAAVRLGLRFQGILDRVSVDDLVPFMIFRPSAGAVWSW